MMRRRCLVLLGMAGLAWPQPTYAQQPAMPVIGFLSAGSANDAAQFVTSFRQGLSEIGFVDGQNVAIEFHWAEGHYDRLTEFAANFVGHRTAVIAAFGPPAALAAKGATQTIPIVFVNGADPVASGLVSSLSRPGGNVTGISLLINTLVAKQVQLLRDIAPNATCFGLLVNPNNDSSESEIKDAEAAAKELGLQVVVRKATTNEDIEPAFADFLERKCNGVLVAADLFLRSRTKLIVTLALRRRLPTISNSTEFAQSGGLVGYGTDVTAGYRQAGIYAGKILSGTKPADLPVLQSTKFELILNLKTAKALGLPIPPSVLSIADEVIE